MKKLSFALMLVLATGQGVVLGKGVKNRLPRLVEVSLPEVARLKAGRSLLTKPLAVLPIEALLDTSNFDNLYPDKHKDTRHTVSAEAIGATGGLLLGASIFNYLVVFDIPSLVSFEDLGLTAVFAVSVGISVGLVVKAIKMAKGSDKREDIHRILVQAGAKENNIENNIVIYDYDGKYHIGMFSDSVSFEWIGKHGKSHIGLFSFSDTHDGFTVVDALGNERLVEREQLLQLVAIRDGLLPDRFSFKNSGKPCNLSANAPSCYEGKTLAFNYRFKNNLGTIEDVRFAADGQGSLIVTTAAGEELTITSGEQGEPVVVDPNTGEESQDQFRGVVFLPF